MAVLRHQRSSDQRSRRLQPLNASGPETPGVQQPSGQRSRDTSGPAVRRLVLMPAAPGCQRSQDASGPEMPTAPSRQQPRHKVPRHPKPRAALSTAVASSGQPCQSGIVGSRVRVIQVVLLVIRRCHRCLFDVRSSLVREAVLSRMASSWEQPCLGSNLLEQQPRLGSGLFLGAAPIMEWPPLRSSLL